MGVQKNATYKVHNGTDFDVINFKTIASQVKMASGLDLESGFANSKTSSGYTKLPNGLILQWGNVVGANIISGTYIDTTITYPISFPNSVLFAATNIYSVDTNNVYTAKYNLFIHPFMSSAQVYGVNLSPGVGALADFYWFAIGY